MKINEQEKPSTYFFGLCLLFFLVREKIVMKILCNCIPVFILQLLGIKIGTVSGNNSFLISKFLTAVMGVVFILDSNSVDQSSFPGESVMEGIPGV